MYLYVELWKARPKWLELTAEQRGEYFEGVGSAIESLLEGGTELVGFALNDSDTPHRAGYRYIAVWKMADLDQVKALENSVESAGWHEYFKQENARGQIISPPDALEDMATL